MGFSPGQGKPTQEVSWASEPTRQMDIRRDRGGPCCSWGVPHPLRISTIIVTTKLAAPGSGVLPVPMQCSPSPPCRSWPGVLGVARLQHD